MGLTLSQFHPIVQHNVRTGDFEGGKDLRDPQTQKRSGPHRSRKHRAGRKSAAEDAPLSPTALASANGVVIGRQQFWEFRLLRLTQPLERISIDTPDMKD